MNPSIAAPPEPDEVDAGPPDRGRATLLRPGLALRAVLVVVVILAGLLVGRAAVGLLRPHLYAGTVLQSPTAAPGLDGLVLASGRSADLAALDGDVVLLYFGYTNCPDICPTTLSAVARARAGLSADQQARVHLLMISVDPGRDDLVGLQSYVEFFDDRFLAVGGDVEVINRVAAQYGVFYELGEGTAETGYTVDHTASLLGVGPDGHLRVVWAPDVESDRLEADLAELLS